MNILSILNEQQQKAVTYCEGPQLVVAGPGSGKTRVLTYKIAYLVDNLGLNPSEILAVTFTNKAANEIKNRVSVLLQNRNLDGIWMGTFHGICARILRLWGKSIGIPPSYTIFDDSDSRALIKSILKDLKVDSDKFSPGSVLASISSAKSELVDTGSFSKYAYGSFLEKVAEVYKIYEKKLQEQNALDFDDLLGKTVLLLRTQEVAKNYFCDLFKYVLVDEYQDTNHAQYIFTKIISSKSQKICVVGDISQSIYSFRGADFKNLLLFEKDFPNVKVFSLGKNYRSTKTIVSASRSLIENNKSHVKIDLETDNEGGEKINLYEAESEEDEASYVIQIIKDKINDRLKYKDFAILYRTNAQSRSIEEHLIKNGIPYRLVGGVRFYDRKEIKDAVSFLRILHNPKDFVSWERIINVPPRKIGEKTLEELKKNKFKIDFIAKNTAFPITEMFDASSKMAPAELLDYVLEKTNYLKYIDDGTEEGEYRKENLMELRSVSLRFHSLPDFLENISLVNPQDLATDKSKKIVIGETNAVNLMTLHQAKGLEFSVVFLIGLEEGLFPHLRSLDSEFDIEEERRLCYVGITRAKELLCLTYAYRRLYLGVSSYGVKSRFIEEIPDNLINVVKETEGFFRKNNQENVHKQVDEFLDFLEAERQKF
jgi:DNA helicase-2/ATP-dependent DNA helicase PcrA